MTGAGAVAWVC